MFYFLCLTSPLVASVDPPPLYPVVDQEENLTVEENLHDGRVLILSNGSAWEIAPQSLNTAQEWIIPSPLRIIPSHDPVYPYKIVDLQTHTFVLARPMPPGAPWEPGQSHFRESLNYRIFTTFSEVGLTISN